MEKKGKERERERNKNKDKKKKQEKEIAERATRESKKIFAGRWARVGSGSW